MLDLLTRDEYAALSSDLLLPANCFIDGKFRPSLSGATFVSTNPATGEPLAAVAACGAADVNLAVRKARQAFEDGRWSKMAPAARKEVLIRLCKLMTRNRRELAVMESIESGKPIRDCDSIDVPEAIETIKWHAELIDKVYDKSAPAGDDAMAIIVREPVGVVGAVIAWNFPLLIAAWKIGPALAAGNSVILKPSEQTSLTALRLAELAMEAGLPDGVLNVVTGTGPEVGAPLGRHMDVDMVTFTGSTEIGRRFLRYSADSNLKKVTLECGGKNPFVVLEGAEDLDMVAEHFVTGAFWNMGENCSASSRLIIHEAVRDELLDRVLARAADWRTGDPLDPVNRLGPLVDESHHRKVCSYLRAGSGEAVETLLGGRPLGGLYVEPTIFDVTGADSVLAKDEIFGPVAAVTTVAGNETAIRMANDTPYGLAASVFSGNLREALRAARGLRAGTVTVNCYGEGDISTPFGGYKQSGFGGRDNSVYAHEQYTELKTIWIDLSDRTLEESID